jgi:hypothetical protein
VVGEFAQAHQNEVFQALHAQVVVDAEEPHQVWPPWGAAGFAVNFLHEPTTRF